MRKEGLSRGTEWAVVGPASSGKSTIVEVFNRKLKNTSFGVLDDPVRPYFNKNRDIFVSSVHQRAIQDSLLKCFLNQEHEAHMQKDKTIVLRDGSLFDPSILTEFFGDVGGAKKLFMKVQSELDHYRGFFLLDPTDIPYEQDPLRQETPEQRLMSFEAYQKFLDQHRLNYIILTGPFTQRLEKIETTIYQYIPDKTIFSQPSSQTSLT